MEGGGVSPGPPSLVSTLETKQRTVAYAEAPARCAGLGFEVGDMREGDCGLR